ncbi:hypothetical protein Forpe1208_v012053 [Fusarium oxysporum f. sp. rapae]|uniref:Uncharacterized protein n=1 Tax=Fusarium oxysporum f. sp. rapae TaxID=485398 RepID=A0A8J5U3B1_FUSOX|nr:hypothetical protein Forpe1208_v012053 [Fusarium oxysporum f. sp. rapae]
MALVMRQCDVKDDWIPGLLMPLTIHDLGHGRKYHNELSCGNEDQDHGRHRESLRQLLEKFDPSDWDDWDIWSLS